jgi:hypothetical protein
MAQAATPFQVENEILRQELDALKAAHQLDVIGFDGTFYGIVLRDWRLPPGRFVYTATPGTPITDGTPAVQVDVLLRIQKLYPHSAPDMFWIRPFVRLPSGAVPQASESREDYFGFQWQRFSWHLKSGWTPIQDTLLDYVAFVDRRLQQGD